MTRPTDTIKAITVERNGAEIEIRVGGTYISTYGHIRVAITSFLMGREEPNVKYWDPIVNQEITVPISWLDPLSALEQLAEVAK